VCARANPEQLFRDAQQAQQSGNNELVVQKYQPTAEPQSPRGIHPEKASSLTIKITPQCRPPFPKAIVANPDDFQAHLYLGAIFYIQRQIDAAREHSDRAITLQPDSFLARYQLARVEIVQGKRPPGILKPRSMPRPIGSRHA
jgi:tetratricopeptide (TPR) repeat protein